MLWEVHVLKRLVGHPNVVSLVDAVELANQAAFLVMRRIEVSRRCLGSV